MKARVTIASVALFTGLMCSPARGILPHDAKGPEDFDKRTKNSPSAVSAAGATRQQRAILSLQSRVTGLQVRSDNMLNSPIMVSSRRGFLTGPGGRGKAVSDEHLEAFPSEDTNRVIKAFLNENADVFGHNARVLDRAKLHRDFTTGHNGLRTVVWQQTLNDIPVFEARLTGHITRSGELVSVSSSFVPEVGAAADRGAPAWASLLNEPVIPAVQALGKVVSDAGADVDTNSFVLVDEPQGPERRHTFNAEGLLGPAWIELVWLPFNQETMRLCWRVIVSTREGPYRFMYVVDAESEEIVIRRNMTVHISPATYNVFTNDSPSPFSPGWDTPSAEQPPLAERALVTLDALSTNASPAGWINDGDMLTQGNNADAFRDRNLDTAPDVPRPNGGADRVFDFPIDLDEEPLTYWEASTVEMFYRVNWFHDRLYQLGFTEAAGNYQVNNFGRGGFGNDPILCLVQAGADISQSDNAFFFPSPDGIPGYVAMFLWSSPDPQRDGSLDSEVIIHELAHGLSDRLLGGGVGISQLQTSGMGEGWSDFYALALLSEQTDDPHANYAMGGYVTDNFGGELDQNYYFGIRRYPYTTDMDKNPLTFKDIDPFQADPHFGVPISPVAGGGPANEVHLQGEVWCVALWESRANLIDKWGWEIGNEMMLQLVTDGLKLAPANATFLQARDAIIQADDINNGGDNYAELWAGFAKRGMGFSATAPPSSTTFGVVEAFDLPPDIIVPIPDGILEVRVVPASTSALLAGEEVPVFVRVSDASPMTNATITATLSTGGNLAFANDGEDPDLRENDGTYTTNLQVPTNGNSITITFDITAPEKDPNTTVVTYFIVQPPPNDNFANALKVPAKGATYLTSNQRATLQEGEPVHANVASVKASLWWDYTPSANTNVLVDTGGSDHTTVVAVYTNNVLTNLQSVVSSVGDANRRTAFVHIPAKAGVNYHIAVAGADTLNVGTIRLNVAPGGQPDTNAPTLTVSSPASGIVVSTNRLFLSGSAVDPSGPSQSGIKDILINVIPSPSVGQEETTIVVRPPVSLDGPVSTNWSSIIGLLEGLNTIRVTATDFAGNRSVPITLEATYRPFDPPNDFFVNAIALTDLAATNLVNTLRGTKEVGEPVHAGNPGGRSVWWTFQPPSDGSLTLSTTNSTFDTLLAVYTGNSVAALTPLASNDDAFPGGADTFSQLVLGVRTGATYRIVLDGYDGAGGAAFLTHTFVPTNIYRLEVTSSTGGTVAPGSGDYPSGVMVELVASPAMYFQFSGWEGSVSSQENPLGLTIDTNINLTAMFSQVVFADGFESGNFQNLPWTFSGNLPWVVQTNVTKLGGFAARSGAIGHNQTSSLILTTNFNAGNVSFEYRVSSEPLYDTLGLYLDGALVQQWSGEVDWSVFSLPVTEGEHTLLWRYSKDSSLSAGSDAAFIDNLILPEETEVVEPLPPVLTLNRQPDGSLMLEVQGGTNQQYIIQGTGNFSLWESLTTNTAVGGIILFTDPQQGANDIRFYRAVAP